MESSFPSCLHYETLSTEILQSDVFKYSYYIVTLIAKLRHDPGADSLAALPKRKPQTNL